MAVLRQCEQTRVYAIGAWMAETVGREAESWLSVISSPRQYSKISDRSSGQRLLIMRFWVEDIGEFVVSVVLWTSIELDGRDIL